MIKKIVRTSAFKRDFRRLKKADAQNMVILETVVSRLVEGIPLAKKYRDHALTGNWKNFRDCHIKPDLILVYSFPDNETLRLERMGSHAELFF